MTEETGAEAPNPAPAAESAPAEVSVDNQEKTQTEESAASGDETSGTEETSEEKERRKLSRSQRYTRKISALSGRLAETDETNARLKKEIEQLRAGSANAPPKESDFPDPFEFAAKRAAYEAEEKLSPKIRDLEQRLDERSAQQREHQAALKFQERKESVSKAVPDFIKKVSEFTNEYGSEASKALVEEIRDSERGPELMYYMAEHPDVFEDLNDLDPRELSRAVGRLEASGKLSVAQSKKQTAAPAPLKTVGGGAAAPFDQRKGPDDMGSYAKWFQQREAAKRR